MDHPDPRIAELVRRLDLRRKVLLLTGRDFWSTHPLEEIGLRSVVVSDGPAGVRGPVWDERDPSLSLPSATALSSAWDAALALEYGAVAASEARRKGVDVVLGPTINLHRSPLGGRHFEAFSEDPLLTSVLAAAYVVGLQENGVGATPKHYVANDFETERFTADVEVSDRALRELYLRAFEDAVVEAHAWLVMSAYNSVNGSAASESPLLETPLNSEWGFDGVVISDWTAVRSVNSARFPQDLVMPGPVGPWGETLVAAVEAGEIPETVIDRKVGRLLLLASRVGALEGFAPPAAPREVDGVAFARRAAAAGIVMVENDGILPLGRPTSIAVIGHNATAARSQGGGSATVVPEYVVSPLDGIRVAFPDAEISSAIGAIVQNGLSDLPLAQIRNPVTGEPGTRVTFSDASGVEIFAEDRRATSYVWFGGDAPIQRTAVLEVTTSWTPDATGEVLLGAAAVGRTEIFVDGEPLLDVDVTPDGDDLGAARMSSSIRSAPLAVTAGRTLELRIRHTRGTADSALDGALDFSFGEVADDREADRLLDEAEAFARDADVVVLVVGTHPGLESEGFDRTGLALPGRQDELARRVLAANPRTIVVVNAGSPVEMRWADEAAAVLLSWFGGQEYGSALADVLSGAVEPGGRLPTTWARNLADAPVTDVTPRDGRLAYTEGIHIGYRAWLRAGVEPRWWFGAGGGYTRFETGALRVSGELRPGGSIRASVDVANVGKRRGRHVVQLYAARATSAVERPVRWLVGFGAVDLEPDARTRIDIEVPARAFAHWDSEWRYEPGTFSLTVGSDAGHPGEWVAVELTEG